MTKECCSAFKRSRLVKHIHVEQGSSKQLSSDRVYRRPNYHVTDSQCVGGGDLSALYESLRARAVELYFMRCCETGTSSNCIGLSDKTPTSVSHAAVSSAEFTSRDFIYYVRAREKASVSLSVR